MRKEAYYTWLMDPNCGPCFIHTFFKIWCVPCQLRMNGQMVMFGKAYLWNTHWGVLLLHAQQYMYLSY
jgi:ABC-type glycerol-3-phosphate transport system permease component